VRRDGRGRQALSLAIVLLSGPGAAKAPETSRPARPAAIPLEEGAELELSSDGTVKCDRNKYAAKRTGGQ